MGIESTRQDPKKASPITERLFYYLPHSWVLVVGGALFQLALIPNIDAYNVQRIIQLALFGGTLVLVFLCVLLSKSRTFYFLLDFGSTRNVSLAGLTIVILGVSLSIYNAKWPRWALLDLEYLILLVIMTWIVWRSFYQLGSKHWQRFGFLVAASMLLYSVRSVLDVLIAYPLSESITATPGFSNIRMYADVAVVLIPFSWLSLIGSDGFKSKFSVWLLSVFWVWLLVLTEARSAILSLLLSVIWVTYRYGKPGWRALRVSLSVLLSSVLIYFLAPVMSVGGYSRDLTSSSGRFELWALALADFAESFPAGIGGMMFAADGRYGVAHPHNLFFTLMAEWGALFVVGISVIVIAAIKTRRRWSEPETMKLSQIRIPIVMAAVAGSVNLMFSGAQIIPFSAVALVLAWGAYLSLYLASSEISPVRKKVTLLSLIGVFCVWGHSTILAQDLYVLAEGAREACSASSEILFPRFWIQGRLDCGGLGY